MSIKKRLMAAAAAAAVLMALGGGIAYASIPGPDGTIYGCYKTSSPGQGALITIDSTTTCPSGTTALNWNQTGPQGPAGPQATSLTATKNVHVPGYCCGSYEVDTATIDCPSGYKAINGGVEQTLADPGDTGGEAEVVLTSENSLTGSGAQPNLSLPRPVNNGYSWKTAFRVFYSSNGSTNTGVTVTLYAVCE